MYFDSGFEMQKQKGVTEFVLEYHVEYIRNVNSDKKNVQVQYTCLSLLCVFFFIKLRWPKHKSIYSKNVRATLNTQYTSANSGAQNVRGLGRAGKFASSRSFKQRSWGVGGEGLGEGRRIS